MQKISVFAQYVHGDSFYKNEYCTGNTTILEIIQRCNLSTTGASVYINGTRLNKKQWEKTISELKVPQSAFLSLRYGE